eukprot:1158474-Pelagomonas_calceolata.AAC.2
MSGMHLANTLPYYIYSIPCHPLKTTHAPCRSHGRPVLCAGSHPGAPPPALIRPSHPLPWAAGSRLTQVRGGGSGSAGG